MTVDLDSPVHWINSAGGDWNVPANWSTGAVPIPSQDVLIGAPAARHYVVTTSTDVSIDSLLVGAGVTLNITGDLFSLTNADSDPLSNAGIIVIGIGAELEVGEADFHGTVVNTNKLDVSGGILDLLNVTVTNTGGIVEVDASSFLYLDRTSIAGGIVTVAGTLTSTGTSAINNASVSIGAAGLIEATGGTLTIDPSTVTNSGTIEADGAQLVIDDSSVTNTGLLQATGGVNGVLVLDNTSVDNSGGTVVTTDDGTIEADLGATIELKGATIDYGTLTVAGTLTSTGTSAINNASVSIGAAGLIEATGGTLTIDPSTVTNSGTIEADGAQLVIDDSSVTNTELLQATGGVNGVLVLDNTSVDNSGGTVVTTDDGTIEADLGARIELKGATIDYGTLTVAGTLTSTGTSAINNASVSIGAAGLIEATGGTLTIDPSTVTNSGTIEADGAQLVIDDSSVTNTGLLQATGGVNGVLVLDDTIVTNTDGDIEADVDATIELDTASIDDGSITNAGLLQASAGTSTISNLDTGANAGSEQFINTGTIQVTGDGTRLILDTDILDNTGGTVQVDADSNLLDAVTAPILELKTTSIDEGTISNAGLLQASAGTSTLSDVGDGAGEQFTNTGTIQVTGDGTRLILDTDILDNTGGTIQVDADSNLLDAVAAPILELKTTIIISGTVTNYGLIHATSGDNEINDALVNNYGTVEVAAGATLTIDPSTVINTGLLLVTGTGGVLVLDHSVVTNTNGDTEVDADATLELKSATINNGIVTIDGMLTSIGISTINDADLTVTGTLEATGDASALTDDTLTINDRDVTNDGLMLVTAGATLNLEDLTVEGDGEIQVDGTLQISGDVELEDDITTSKTGAVAILSGSSGDDTVSLTGLQLNIFTTIDLAGGIDTIFLRSTSSGLNDLSNGNLANVEVISAVDADDGVVIDLSAQLEGFTITGSSDADEITGSAGADKINAVGGNDIINGAQNDTLLDGGSGNDDTLRVGADFTSTDNNQIKNIENVELTASGLVLNLSNQSEGFTIIGSAAADTITGSSGADTITGGAGADIIVGGGGGDTINLAQGDFVATEFDYRRLRNRQDRFDDEWHDR